MQSNARAELQIRICVVSFRWHFCSQTEVLGLCLGRKHVFCETFRVRGVSKRARNGSERPPKRPPVSKSASGGLREAVLGGPGRRPEAPKRRPEAPKRHLGDLQEAVDICNFLKIASADFRAIKRRISSSDKFQHCRRFPFTAESD